VRVIILGANGSGKSTVGHELANLLTCAHFDTEDYWFHKSEIPYTTSRPPEERNALFFSDIKKYDSYVVSGSVSQWDKAFLKLFDLAVFLEVPSDIRVERIENREHDRFGNRIRKCGDMYEQHLKFIEYANHVDIPLLKKEAEKYFCPVIYVDGTENYNSIVKKIKKRIS
jgi:adenylate kinase family enzyme